MTRPVTLVHTGGGRKEGLSGELVRGASPKTAKVDVLWPGCGLLTFVALTGLEHRNPRGQWRLSPEDVAAFAEQLGCAPISETFAPLKRRRKTETRPDPRQLWLTEEDR